MKLFLSVSIMLLTSICNSQTGSDTVLNSEDFLDIPYDIFGNCNQFFSKKKIDSSYSSYYVNNEKDTTYYQSADCMVQFELTSPLTIKHIIKDGYAEGYLEFHSFSDTTFSVLYGTYQGGVIGTGSYIEHYNSGGVCRTGQYASGQKTGIWTDYYPTGEVKRISSFIGTNLYSERNYDIQGNITSSEDY